jgi:hypothetical protein
MGKPIEITRFEHSATELREVAARIHDGAAVRVFWQLPWCWRDIRVTRRRSLTAWIVKRCATGCCATTRKAWLDCVRVAARGALRN